MKLIIIIIIISIIYNKNIAFFNFINNDNREIKDYYLSSNTILLKNYLKHDINLNKNENIINKSKFNFIKDVLIKDGEIFIEIEFDIKRSNNERICLFCLKNEKNNYDFAIIKTDGILEIINNGDKIHLKWDDNYEIENIQKILFVFNKEGRHLYINNEKINTFKTNNNNDINFKEWNDNLNLYIGGDENIKPLNDNSYLNIFKIRIFNTK